MVAFILRGLAPFTTSHWIMLHLFFPVLRWVTQTLVLMQPIDLVVLKMEKAASLCHRVIWGCQRASLILLNHYQVIYNQISRSASFQISTINKPTYSHGKTKVHPLPISVLHDRVKMIWSEIRWYDVFVLICCLLFCPKLYWSMWLNISALVSSVQRILLEKSCGSFLRNFENLCPFFSASFPNNALLGQLFYNGSVLTETSLHFF